ncbi:MAG TPA: STAS domain-containing protein [Terriglobia bacterium]|nr:STAS domain-containing protein [Terriglobia bacterium]
MKVQVRNVDNVSVIDCSGDVDLYSSTDLRGTLLKEMRSGKPNVLVNMTGVSYIDSSGIATLVEGLQLSRETKTRFGLFGLRSNARSVLELARLHTVFAIFDNEKEALEKIATTEPFGGL